MDKLQRLHGAEERPPSYERIEGGSTSGERRGFIGNAVDERKPGDSTCPLVLYPLVSSSHGVLHR